MLVRKTQSGCHVVDSPRVKFALCKSPLTLNEFIQFLNGVIQSVESDLTPKILKGIFKCLTGPIDFRKGPPPMILVIDH